MQVKQSTHKVFKVTPGAKSTSVRIGDSKKNMDGTYDNFYWNAMLVSNAHTEIGNVIEEGDKLVIVEGQAYLNDFRGKTYGNVTVFKAEVIKGEEKAPVPPTQTMPDPPVANDEKYGYDPLDEPPF